MQRGGGRRSPTWPVTTSTARSRARTCSRRSATSSRPVLLAPRIARWGSGCARCSGSPRSRLPGYAGGWLAACRSRRRGRRDGRTSGTRLRGVAARTRGCGRWACSPRASRRSTRRSVAAFVLHLAAGAGRDQPVVLVAVARCRRWPGRARRRRADDRPPVGPGARRWPRARCSSARRVAVAAVGPAVTTVAAAAVSGIRALGRLGRVPGDRAAPPSRCGGNDRRRRRCDRAARAAAPACWPASSPTTPARRPRSPSSRHWRSSAVWWLRSLPRSGNQRHRGVDGLDPEPGRRRHQRAARVARARRLRDLPTGLVDERSRLGRIDQAGEMSRRCRCAPVVGVALDDDGPATWRREAVGSSPRVDSGSRSSSRARAADGVGPPRAGTSSRPRRRTVPVASCRIRPRGARPPRSRSVRSTSTYVGPAPGARRILSCWVAG